MPSKRPPNLLILAVDTLRADRMSCYGHTRLTTPHIDRLASQGVLFERAYCPNVPTTPAYSSMLTGMDVMTTRMVALQSKWPLPEQLKTMPELLREPRNGGYVSACVGFSGKAWTEERFRGFDQYHDFRSWMSWEERPGDKAGQLNEVTLPVLDEFHKSGQPWLLFLRHMDPHSPYLPPAPFDRLFYSGDEKDPAHLKTERSMRRVFDFAPFAEFFKSWMPPGVTDTEYVIAQYDGALAYMDACIQRLLTRLEELGIADETVVLLTGDHGESFLEHDIFFDHHGLYEPTIHVPLIVKAPGLPSGVRVPGYVTHQDMLPTLLDLMGNKRLLRELKPDGQSVVPLALGERRTNYSELYLTECTWMRKRGWRTHEWKLIEALEPDFHSFPSIELYNLLDDPLETRNLAESEPEMVMLLRHRMQTWVAKRVKETGQPDPILEYQIGTEKKIGSVGQARRMQAQAAKKAAEKQATQKQHRERVTARRGAAKKGKAAAKRPSGKK
ncbi:MAG TPA: sulfatase [Chloroflexota bacterium]|nr:sulfatase [Chloroflexota bacterium]